MTALFVLSSAVLGLLLGSFLNVLVSRFPFFLRGEGVSPFLGRSKCDQCQKTLFWYELIPLVSYAVLRGKCGTCGSHIPFRYSIVEGLTAVLFAGSAFMLVHDANAALFLMTNAGMPLFLLHIGAVFLGVFSLLAIFSLDLSYEYIPDTFLVLLFLSGLFESWFRITYLDDSGITPLLWTMLGIFLLFFSLWFFSKGRGMGFGDVKFAPILPLFLGWFSGFVAVLLAFWIGAGISLILLFSGGKSLKDHIPFGPFLVLGSYLVLFFPGILSWFAFLKDAIV